MEQPQVLSSTVLGTVQAYGRPPGLPRGSWGEGRPSFWCSKDPSVLDLYEVCSTAPLPLYFSASRRGAQVGTLAVGSTVSALERREIPSSCGSDQDGTWIRTGKGWVSAWGGVGTGAANLRAVRQCFLVEQQHAARFRSEHPDCTGAALISHSNPVDKGVVAAKLVTCSKPPGAISSSSWKRGAARFENEVVELTAAGSDNLERGTRKNLIVWRLAWRCGGIDTYVCTTSTAVLRTPPEAAAARATGSVSSSAEAAAAPTSTEIARIDVGATVLAAKTKIVDGITWIRVGQGWARTTETSGTEEISYLRPSGCLRQCGGVCACAQTCTKQIKSRHGCNVQIKMERTLQLVSSGPAPVLRAGSERERGTRTRRKRSGRTSPRRARS